MAKLHRVVEPNGGIVVLDDGRRMQQVMNAGTGALGLREMTVEDEQVARGPGAPQFDQYVGPPRVPDPPSESVSTVPDMRTLGLDQS